GEAVMGGGGGRVGDAAGCCALHGGDGPGAGAPVAGQVDRDAPLPVGRVDVLDQGGRAGDAGVVDEHVQRAATVGEHAVEPGVERVAVGDVDHGGDQAGLSRVRNSGVVSVADVDACASGGEGRSDRAP